MQSTKPIGGGSPPRLTIEEKSPKVQSLSDSETESASQRERSGKLSPHSPRNTSMPPNLKRLSISGLRWLFRLGEDALSTLDAVFGREKAASESADQQNAPDEISNRKQLINGMLKKLPQNEKEKFSAMIRAHHDDCDAFKSDDFAKVGHVVDKFKTKPENLAQTIAADVLIHGGKTPVLFSTEDDAEDRVHQDAIEKAAQETNAKLPNVVGIAAGDRVKQPGWDWASMINAMMHLSPNSRHQEAIERMVKEYVDKVPSDASAVYLCNPNYSAFKGRIEKCLTGKGLDDVPVVDCTQAQLRSDIRRFAEVSAAGPQVKDAIEHLLASQPARASLEASATQSAT